MENALILSFSVEISMVLSSEIDTARLAGSHQLPITRHLQLRTQFSNFEFEVNALIIKCFNDTLAIENYQRYFNRKYFLSLI